MDDRQEGAIIKPEELTRYRRIDKEEFVRRMLSDASKRKRDIRYQERQKNRIINEYISDNVNGYHHKMHRRTRGKM